MGIESVSGIWDLDEDNPLSTDDRTSSDDHHRLIKTAITNTFPNLSATVHASDTEINYATGLESTVQPQLNTLSATVALLAVSAAELATLVDAVSSNLQSVDSGIESLSTQYANTFHAHVSSGVFVSDLWPANWQADRLSTGTYQITHNLGTQAYVCSLVRVGATSVGNIFVGTKARNFLTIVTTTPSASYQDASFYLTVRKSV